MEKDNKFIEFFGLILEKNSVKESTLRQYNECITVLTEEDQDLLKIFFVEVRRLAIPRWEETSEYKNAKAVLELLWEVQKNNLFVWPEGAALDGENNENKNAKHALATLQVLVPGARCTTDKNKSPITVSIVKTVIDQLEMVINNYVYPEGTKEPGGQSNTLEQLYILAILQVLTKATTAVEKKIYTRAVCAEFLKLYLGLPWEHEFAVQSVLSLGEENFKSYEKKFKKFAKGETLEKLDITADNCYALKSHRSYYKLDTPKGTAPVELAARLLNIPLLYLELE